MTTTITRPARTTKKPAKKTLKKKTARKTAPANNKKSRDGGSGRRTRNVLSVEGTLRVAGWLDENKEHIESGKLSSTDMLDAISAFMRQQVSPLMVRRIGEARGIKFPTPPKSWQSAASLRGEIYTLVIQVDALLRTCDDLMTPEFRLLRDRLFHK